MLDFTCDYNNGAHPSVLRRLVDTNGITSGTYGFDEFSKSASDKIRAEIGDKDAPVYFLAGGTQTNMTVISSCLLPYQGVLCAATGHINGHEAGAVEATGHKVLPLPSHDGKVLAHDLSAYMKTFEENESRDHTVFPGMLYISYPTEYGTLYSLTELEELSRVCKRYGLLFFCDGARLGYGLLSPECDITMADLHRICDVFYIGGTKVGALCGEAVVFKKEALPAHFMTLIKQRGALLAKGRLAGVQFDALFTDGLYYKIAKTAIDRARELKEVFAAKGYKFFIDSPTNQQFVVLSDEKARELSKNVLFEVWEKTAEGDTVARFVTSWSTAASQIEELGRLL